MNIRKLVAAAALCSGALLAHAQAVELKFVGFAPPKSGSELITNWWMDEIEARTKGAIKFKRFPAGQLCKGPDIVACVRDGRADAGSTPPAYTPALFPINALDGLPYISSDQVAIAKGFATLYAKSKEFRAEHEKLGLRLQIIFPADPLLIGTKFEVKDLSVFDGKRIRAVGIGPAAFAKALGAQPVAVATHEMYEGLQTGVLSGFTNTFEGATTQKLFEVTDHWYDPGFGVYAAVAMWMSDRTWRRLPAAQQKVVEQVTRELTDGKFMELYNQALKGTCESLKASGKIKAFRKWDASMAAQVKAKIGDGPYQTWAENVQKAGSANAKGIYDTYVAAVKGAEKSTSTPADACIAAFK